MRSTIQAVAIYKPCLCKFAAAPYLFTSTKVVKVGHMAQNNLAAASDESLLPSPGKQGQTISQSIWARDGPDSVALCVVYIYPPKLVSSS